MVVANVLAVNMVMVVAVVVVVVVANVVVVGWRPDHSDILPQTPQTLACHYQKTWMRIVVAMRVTTFLVRFERADILEMLKQE